MIPDPGYTQANAARAMSQADLFVQQTRAQAAQQLSQPAAAFTGGVGGAQPGIMSYAAGRVGTFAGGFGAAMQQATGAAIGGVAGVPAAIAALATPGLRQFGDIIEGARYTGGGAPPMTLAGMLATGYAPTGLFPHAGMAFGMERGLRREMAREELGRRTTQGVRAGMHTIAHGATLGLSSYMMRRSGLEASWLTEMETERTLQNRLGFLRGEAGYEAYTGRGVRRGFFQEGPGRAAIGVLQQRAGDLQSRFGYGTEQMNMLTRMAAGAVDVTRIQQAAAGGQRGMRGLGREISDIRETASAMAREMQMSEQEIQEFFGRLKGVMKITGEGIRDFQQENRRLSQQGPFSQRQVGEMRVQFTQMGRQMYMGGMDFGTQAMEQANRVAELRRSGVISAETLLREGGGLDPQAMARMMAQRLQEQAGLVQAGNFNQALVLAAQDPGAFGAMMGGAGFFQTQAAVGGVMARNPFALLQAQLDPNAVRRVTMQAPAIAFQKAQQMGELFVAGNEEQRRAQMIRKFGRQMGLNVRTAQGLGKSRTRYEELETQREMIEIELRDVFVGARGEQTRSEMDIRQMGSNLMGIMQETGESAGTLAMVMNTITNDNDLQRRWSSGTAEARSRIAREVLAGERAETLSGKLIAAGESIVKGLSTSPEVGLKRARNLALSLEREGISRDLIQEAVWGDLGDYQLSESSLGSVWEGGGLLDIVTDEKGRRNYGRFIDLERRKLEVVGEGKSEMTTERMRMSTGKIQDEIEKYGLKTKDELMAHLADLSGWHSRETKEVTDTLDDEIVMQWEEQFMRTGKRFSVESIRQAGMARDEWRRARRKGAGVFDIIRLAGVDIPLDMARGVTELLEMDKQKTLQFEQLEQDARLAPIVEVIRKFGGEGIETRRDFTAMTGIIGRTNMRNFFKEYAASEEGTRRLGGKTFQEFLGRAPMERMNELFQGMSEGEKRAFMVRTLTSAIEKSQRLVNETKRGDPGKPMHVTMDKETLENLKALTTT